MTRIVVCFLKMAFSTDADYYILDMDRGQVVIDFLKSRQAANIPAAGRSDRRPGQPARGSRRAAGCSLVMKDGVFFKKEGVMAPAAFFHSGPVPASAWRVHQ
jgi:hypothetical protein